MSRYVLEARLPDGERIRGARVHTSLDSVRTQLRRTAPEWRQAIPGVKFRVLSVDANAARNGPMSGEPRAAKHASGAGSQSLPLDAQEVKQGRRRSRK